MSKQGKQKKAAGAEDGPSSEEDSASETAAAENLEYVFQTEADAGGASPGGTRQKQRGGKSSNVMFTFDPKDVLQISNPTRNDIHVELAENEEEEEAVCDVRFYVLPQKSAEQAAGVRRGARADGKVLKKDRTGAEQLKEQIQASAGLVTR